MNKFSDPIENFLNRMREPNEEERDYTGPTVRVFRPWAKVVLWCIFAVVLSIGALGLYVELVLRQ